MPVWTSIRLRDGTSHTCDPLLADAWANQAVALSNDGMISTLTNRIGTAQNAGTMTAWQALGYAYQAANFPPTSDLSVYHPVMASAYGPKYDFMTRSVIASQIPAGWVVTRSNSLGLSAAMTKAKVPYAEYGIRASLTPAGVVIGTTVAIRPEGAVSADGRACQHTDDWRCLTWQQQGTFKVLPPMLWSMNIVSSLAQALKAKTAEQMMNESVGAGERLPTVIANDTRSIQVPDPPGWTRPTPHAPLSTAPVGSYGGLSGPVPASTAPSPGTTPAAPPASTTPAPSSTTPAPMPDTSTPTPPASPAPTDTPSDTSQSPAPGQPPAPSPWANADGASLLSALGLTCATWPTSDSAKADTVTRYFVSKSNTVLTASDVTALVAAVDRACAATLSPTPSTAIVPAPATAIVPASPTAIVPASVSPSSTVSSVATDRTVVIATVGTLAAIVAYVSWPNAPYKVAEPEGVTGVSSTQ